MWEGLFSLVPVSVVDIYDAGEEMIGELLEEHGTGIRRCWDEQYPEEWYYGQDGVANERRASYRSRTMGRADIDPQFMEVANVNWVNLRKQDSKISPSLAKLDAGTEVQVLAKDCGTDRGWVRVYISPNEGETGLTGYIWHSYLKPVVHTVEVYPKAIVVNADWVNVRERGTKESAAITTVNAGESVYVISERNGFENGWTEVLVMKAGQEPVTGYIWWSFLEKEE